MPEGSGDRTSGPRTPGHGTPVPGKPGPGVRRRRASHGRTRVNPGRRIAFDVLVAVDDDDAYANLLLPARLSRAGLSTADAGLATELTYGTLRGRGLYDAIIAHAAGRPVDKLDTPARNALRLGAHQLLEMNTAAHAAVNETVGLMRATKHMKAAGFVNAVMRRISERSRAEWLDLVTAAAGDDERTGLTYAHPAWIVAALRRSLTAHGRDAGELTALLEADNVPARVCLTALPGLADRQAIAADCGTPTALSPLGVELTSGDPYALAEVQAGRARVQDEGSQLVALGLTAACAPDGPVLDLCAGPGGKTAILAADAAATGTPVVACDVSAHRAELVCDSVRAIDADVTVLTADGRSLADDHLGSYARVLADVPCTGLGALRRRPEARWRRRAADVEALQPIQRELLTRAIELTAPGGVVAYTTCSPHHGETIDIVTQVLTASGTDVEVLDAPSILAKVTGQDAAAFASAKIGTGQAVQLWPHVHGTDGMFLALLRRTR